MRPAFKEWQVIVDVLGAGAQTLLLRKGGIHEGRGGFRVSADRFWLFPTRFHAQREKTKPAAHVHFNEASTDEAVTLSLFAELVESAFVTDWPTVAALAPYHLWTDATVRERFEWSKPRGLHVLILRVHRLHERLTLPLTPEMGGCKSWIKLPPDFDERPSTPVLNDATFAAQLAELRQRIGAAR